MGLSKNQIKQICALHQKKFRQEQGLFIVEGEKIVQEIMQQELFKIHTLIALPEWMHENKALIKTLDAIVLEASGSDLERISALKTPNKVLLVLKKPGITKPENLVGKLSLVLDNLQDPGNLGTIIRIADWFGIEHIFCSINTVELYNPKVLQASMGSFLRVQVHYTDLPLLFSENPDIPRFGAVLQGQDVHTISLPKSAFLMIGNESKGISEEVTPYITQAVRIPSFGAAESLNAAVATGILCALFRLQS